MKQQFLNQKLGKRNSRRQELLKTKNLSSGRSPEPFPHKPR